MNLQIFDSLLEPTFLLNHEKKIIYVNETAAMLIELSVRKAQKQMPLLDEVLNFSDAVSALHNLPNLQDASPYQEVSFKNMSGQEGRAQVTIQPFMKMPPSQEQTWLVFFRDVTLEETLQKKYRRELEQKEVYIQELQIAHQKLSDYSKNLEEMVKQRTQELSYLNTTMKALLDSLGQGFFIFDQKGLVLEISSKACEILLEKNPCGQNIWDVLNLPQDKILGFKKWMITVFAEMLPFQDLAPLAPSTYNHTKGLHIELQYHPIRDPQNKISAVVVVATDMTSLIQAQREAENERANAKMILQIIKNKKQLAGFIRECENMLQELQNEIARPEIDCDVTFRLLHTLKGGAATFSVKAISDRCHEAETLLTEYRKTPELNLKNKLERVCLELQPLFTQFLNENEDIIGNLEKLAERWIEVPASKLSSYAGQWLSHREASLAKQVLSEEFLFEKVADLFSHLDEPLQLMAERMNKKIKPIQFDNPDFKILPEAYERLLSSLVHAFRNCVDHGIEETTKREALGKDPYGLIHLGFELQNDQTLKISISDDGAGIDPQKIREKLKLKNFDSSQETDSQVIQHIFDPQFSTRDVVSEYSGRGVGMDAIANEVQSLGGHVEISSTIGKGSLLEIHVPWISILESQHTKTAMEANRKVS